MPKGTASAPAPPRRLLPVALLSFSAALAALVLVAGCDVQKSFLKIPVGGYWEQLTPPSIDIYYAYPEWRGSTLVFSAVDRNLDTTAFHIGSIRADGTGLLIHPGVYGFNDSWPHFVNDSTVVFGSRRAGSWDIWYENIRDGSTHQLTFTPGHEVHPAPRPGRPGLAYVDPGTTTLNGRIVLMPDTAATSDIHYLTPDTLKCGEPDWDPSGSRVCFSAEGAAGTRHIWLVTIGAADTTVAQLTTGSYQDHGPRFSPDGTRIVFTSERDGVPGVWVVDAAGEASGLRLVATDDPGATIQTAAWSPDGHSLVVSSSGRFVIPEELEKEHPEWKQQALWVLRNLGF